MGDQRQAPAALTPGKNRFPLYRRLVGPQGTFRNGSFWEQRIIASIFENTELAFCVEDYMALLLQWVAQCRATLLYYSLEAIVLPLLFLTICKRIPEKCNKVLWPFLQDLYQNVSRYFRSDRSVTKYKHAPVPLFSSFITSANTGSKLSLKWQECSSRANYSKINGNADDELEDEEEEAEFVES